MDQKFVKDQSVYWLFCWAKTGQNSPATMKQSQSVFNEIFENLTFDDCDKIKLYDRAAKVRYSKDKSIEGEINIKLGR